MVKKTLFAENYPMQTLSRSDQKTVLRLALELVLQLVTTAAWIISILFSRFGSSSSIKGILIWVRISITQLVNLSAFLGETEILTPSSTALSLLQGWTTKNSEEEDLYTAKDLSRATLISWILSSSLLCF